MGIVTDNRGNVVGEFADTPRLATDKRRHALAQHIQTAIEDWIEYEQSEQSRREWQDETCSSHPCPPLSE